MRVNEQSNGVILLKGDLAIGDAQGIKNSMLAILKEFATVMVDFSPLEDLDCSIIQLLYALCQEASKSKKEIVFCGTFSSQVRKRLFASGIINSLTCTDESIITQLTQKIRIAS